MSKSIDDKVVEMRFDNKQFEANVQTSLGTLERLKKGLNLDGAAKGLEGIDKAAKKVDMSNLSDSVGVVQAKFSALEVMGVTALVNLTNSAVNAGKRIASALTIEPVTTGFNEYELKMGSIQTIMAGTGESLERVNEKLDELNKYSDRTIYSFSDMTSNIGKFTNAGVKLDDAVAAIQGVANVAAVSGANATEASRAMYNFGQALSAGYVKLIDWKSIENANMATVEFKQQLIDTAVEMGTIIKVGDKYQSTTRDLNGKVSELFGSTTLFNDSLSSQWMTTEVLTETLRRYADETTDIGKKAYAAATEVKTLTQMWDVLKETAQSGWAETWQLIVGDFNQAKKLFTGLNDTFSGMIDAISDARNNLLKGALSTLDQGGLGGREKLIDTLLNTLEAVLNVLGAVGKAWDAIFPPTTSQQLYNAIDALNQFSKRLIISDETADKLQRTFRGLFAVLDIFKTVIGDSLKAALKAVCSLLGMADVDILSFTANLGDGLVVIRDWVKEHNLLAKGIEWVGTALGSMIGSVRTWISNFMAIPEVSNAVNALGKAFENTGGRLDSFLADGVKRFKDFWERVTSLDGFTLDNVMIALRDLWSTLTGWIGSTDGLFSAFEGPLGTLGTEVAKAFGIMTDTASRAGQAAETAVDKAVNGFIWLKDRLFATALEIRNGLAGKLGFGEIFAIGIGTSIAVVAMKVAKSLSTIEELIEAITNPLEGLGKLLKSSAKVIDAFALGMKSEALINVAKAVLLMVGALAALTLLDQSKLLGAVGILAALSAVLAGLSLAVSKMGDVKKLTSMAATLAAVGASLLMMAGALQTISNLEGNVLGSLVVLGVLGAGLVAFCKIIKSSENEFGKAGLAMLAFSTSLAVLSKAIKNIGEISAQSFLRTLAVLVIVFSGMALVARAGRNTEQVLIQTGFKNKSKNSGTAGTILAAAASLYLIIGALKSIASFDTNELTRGLAATAAIFALFSGVILASRIAGGNASKAGSAIIKMSASLLLIVAAFKIMEGIDPSALTKVTNSVSQIMLVFAAITALSHFAGENATKAGTMLLLMSGAVMILSATMVMLAHLKPDGLNQALKAIIALEAVFGALVVISRFAAEGKKVQVTIITLTACVAALTAIMAALSMIEPDKLRNATIAISALMGVFGLLMASTGISKKETTTILAMTASIAILAAAVAQLSSIEPDRLLNAVVAIDALMAAFAVLIAATGLSKKTSPTILAMGVVVAELAAVLGVMSALNVEPSIQAAVSLSVLLAAFSASMAILSKADPLSKQAVLAAAAMGAVVGELAIVLGIMAVLNVEPSIQTAVALSLLLNAMTASMVVLSKTGSISMGAVAAAAVMGAVVAELALVLGAMVALHVEPSIETAAALSLLLLSMSAALGILTVIGAAGPAAFVGIGALATMIVGLGLIMAAICALTADNPTIEADLDRAIIVLEKIGTGLGAAIGGVVGGAIGGLTSGLPIIGQNLADFMANAAPFFDQAKNIDESAMNGVKALAETFLILTGTNLVESLTSWLTGGTDLGAFACQLEPLGEGLMKFADSVNGISGTDVETAANSAKILAEFAKSLPNEGGVLAALLGDNTLIAFANMLPEFGTKLKEYADNVDGLNVDAVTNSATAAKAVAEMANKLPNSGGILADWIGDNTLTAFATELCSFGPQFMAYAESVEGLNVDTVTASASAASAIAEFASKLPNSGGILADWVGDNTLISFSEMLPQFGENLMLYAEKVTDLEPDVVTTSVNAAEALSALANGLPSISLFDEWFGGKQTLESFGKQLAAFGEQINSFANSMPDVNSEKMQAVFNALQGYMTLADSIKNKSSTQPLTEFTNALKNLASAGIAGFQEAFNGRTTPRTVVVEAMGNATDELDKNKGTFKTIGSGISQSLIDGMNAKREVLSNSAKSLGQIIESGIRSVTKVNSPSPLYISIGEFIDKSLKTGMDQGLPGLSKSAVAVGKTIENGIRDTLDIHSESPMLIEIGGWVTESIARGVDDNADTAQQSVIGAFTGMIDAGKEKLSEFRADMEDPMGALTSSAEAVTSEIMGEISDVTDAVLASNTAQTKSTTSSYSTMTKATDSYYQNKLDWIEEEKYYNRLSLEEELAVYEELLTRYKEGSDERKKIDREIYRLHNELVNEAYQNELDWIEEEKYYDRLTLAEELAKYEEMQQTFEEGSEQRKKIDREVYRLHKELVKESYQASIDWIENEKDYDRMTTAAEIAAYKRVRDEHLADAEIIKECDKKLYALRKQLATEAYQTATTWIDDEKFYDRLNPSEELAALRRIQSMGVGSDDDKKALAKNIYSLEKQLNEYRKQYAEDVADVEEEAAQKRADLEQEYSEKVSSIQSDAAEERTNREKQYQSDIISIQENAATKRADLEEEYADTVTSINEKLVSDIEKLNEDYQNAVESRTDALYKAYNLFDAVKAKEEVSAATLMANLQDQVNEFGDWQDVLDSLSARGLDSELLSELQQMGPSAIAEVKALNSMTDDELDKYTAMWSIKHAQARSQALKELSGMKQDTEDQIQQLRDAAAKELSEYQELWEERMAAITADAEEELASLRVTFENDMAEINSNAQQELAEYEASWQSSMAEVNQNASTKLAELKKDFDEKVGQISDDTESKIQKMVDEILKIMGEAEWKETGEKIVEETTEGVDKKSVSFVAAIRTMVGKALEAIRNSLSSGDWTEAGAMAGEGVAQGLASKCSRVISAAASIGSAALTALRTTLDEHSPSKETEKIGSFGGLGFVNGLLQYVDKAEGAAKQLTDATTQGLTDAMERATQLVESGQAAQPVIRPVLDLSDIWNQSGELNSFFGGTRTISVAGRTGLELSSLPNDAGSLPDTGSENVVSEIKSLRKDLSGLAASVAKLRIVLDSGALVGGIVDPLDNALGQRAIYAERGI